MTSKTKRRCGVDNAAATRAALAFVRNARCLLVTSADPSTSNSVGKAVDALVEALEQDADDATSSARVAALLKAAGEHHAEPVQAGARDGPLTGAPLVFLALSYWQGTLGATHH